MDGPLSGIRVVEAASYVTGPLAAMALADLGADVVKVEPPPRGDPFRNFGVKHAGTSVWFINVNRGKRSALIDLKSGDGHDAFLGLVERADVFVQNWRPGVADGVEGAGDLRATHGSHHDEAVGRGHHAGPAAAPRRANRRGHDRRRRGTCGPGTRRGS